MSTRSPVQSQAKPTFTPVQTGILQRQCASCGQHTFAGGECTECQKKKGVLQRRSANQTELTDVPPIVHEVLRSPGRNLDSDTRAFMESRFGQDFNQVRLHTDEKAAESARSVNALAYTVGNKIVFGARQYAPQTTEGRKLLAHELTHTIQQQQQANPNLISAGLSMTNQSHCTEQQAENIAHHPTFKEMRSTHSPLALKNFFYSAPIQISREAADARIGGTTSSTTPSYTIDEVKRCLSGFNLGPIRGTDVVRNLDEGGWRIFFWSTTGHTGNTFADNRLILLPREASLMANIDALFHEAMHATRPIPRAGGFITDPRAVWANLEEELMAQYQEILFLRAHAATEPTLVNESPFSQDWSRIERMNQGELYRYFREEAVPLTIFGMAVDYRYVLPTFGNDVGRMANSPQVTTILNRVILGWHPRLTPPRPSRPTFPSLIRPRRSFRRELLESVREI